MDYFFNLTRRPLSQFSTLQKSLFFKSGKSQFLERPLEHRKKPTMAPTIELGTQSLCSVRGTHNGRWTRDHRAPHGWKSPATIVWNVHWRHKQSWGSRTPGDLLTEIGLSFINNIILLSTSLRDRYCEWNGKDNFGL